MSTARPPRLTDRLGLTKRTPREHQGRRAARAEREQSSLEDLVIITGFSGAGKSIAMQVFEDAGYFCVDNLPAEMIRGLVELFMHPGSKVQHAAVVCDLRGGTYFEGLEDVLAELDGAGVRYRILFMDADEQSLLNRYKETRRRHPLAPEGSVAQGIALEREGLEPLRALAEAIVDSTGLSAATLRRRIADNFLPHTPRTRLAVTFQSFGFKHGPPREADLSFDVRFLPNPHWEPELRPLTGRDAAVVEYVAADGTLDEFYERLDALLDFLLPRYIAEGKAHLLVAIGCTGGRHRSVSIAERLARHYGGRDDLFVDVAHRDIDKRVAGG